MNRDGGIPSTNGVHANRAVPVNGFDAIDKAAIANGSVREKLEGPKAVRANVGPHPRSGNLWIHLPLLRGS